MRAADRATAARREAEGWRAAGIVLVLLASIVAAGCLAAAAHGLDRIETNLQQQARV